MSVKEIQKEIINNLTSDNSELKREAITELIDQPLDDEIMSMLTECLTDPDKGIRDAASVTLMHNGNPFIPGFVAPLIISPDISVRNSAGEILIAIGENAIPALIPFVNNIDSDNQKFAIDVIGLIGSKTAAQSIMAVLRRSENENVLLACFEALGNIQAEESVKELLLFYEKNELFKPTIIEAIGKIGTHESQNFLIEKFSIEDTFVKCSIIESLGLIGDESTFYFLLSKLNGLEDVLKFPFVKTIYNLKEKYRLQLPYDEKIKELILTTLHEGDAETKKAAVFLVNGFADKEVICSLTDIYGQDTELDMLLKEILVAHYSIILTHISSINCQNVLYKKNMLYLVQEIIETHKTRVKEKVSELIMSNLTDKLIRCLSDPDEEIRILVFETILAIDQEKAILFIDEIIKDENIWNRLKVVELLSDIYDPSVVKALKTLANDEEEMIRTKVLWILSERGITNTNNNKTITV